MGLKVEGILGIEEMIFRLDTTSKRRVVKGLFKNAEKMRDLAQKMAPCDFGALEEAIKLRPDGPERVRDEMGRFTRTEIEVYIDMEMPGGDPKRPDVKVGDYAYYAHEHITPVGNNHLGDKSQLKQAGQRETVGGGFLDRAAEAVDREIDIVLLEAFADVF